MISGAAMRIEHFTLNENEEKLSATTGVIGKFGVGLKDALATFHRRGIEVEVCSPFGAFTLAETSKHGFEDITTLHVEFDPSPNEMTGTEFVLTGITDEQMAAAKSLFLKFNGERVLEATRYGDVLKAKTGEARVYISGVLAAEEPNFLFSYNITNLTDAMRKRLNRERLNVGRTTYADRVKQILREAKTDAVLEGLARAITQRSKENVPDELTWIEVVVTALTRLSEIKPILFVTEPELHTHPDVLDHARGDSLDIVVVTTAEKQKLVAQAEAGGPVTRVLERYVTEFNESFSYSFVDEERLSAREREVFSITPELFALIEVPQARVPKVMISETMRITKDDTDGVWDPELGAIVIKRSRLRSRHAYAGTLLHEAAHALTRTVDATREFESVLTDYLGRTSSAALESEE